MSIHSLRRRALSWLALSLALPGAVLAQHAGHGSTMAAPAPAAASADTAWSRGEVRRIDPANARLTLRHGELVNLNMPPMTMTFELRDAAQLAGLKVGDAVRFQAIDLGAGRLQITALDRAP